MFVCERCVKDVGEIHEMKMNNWLVDVEIFSIRR